MPNHKKEASPFQPASPAPENRISPLITAWAGTMIFLAVLAAYWPALSGSLVWDDNAYVTAPDLRNISGLWRIWFDLGATEQYYPVLHSAFWVEHLLWGDLAFGYHLINVILHATAACLFGLVLRRLLVERVAPNALARLCPDASALGATRSTSEVPLFAALIFALHPVCV